MGKKEQTNPWVCGRCGYIYDPKKGDKKNKIPPNIPFEELNDEYNCPLCGAAKRIFSPMLGYEDDLKN